MSSSAATRAGRRPKPPQPRFFAVGHSTLAAEELAARLASVGVKTLVDVRTVPRSRANPQFNPEAFAPVLARLGIAHTREARLGGLRKGLGAASPNVAWRNASFRAYADHALTTEFRAGLDALVALAGAGPVAFMCAEGSRFRCHRSLISDHLLARGLPVAHLTGVGRFDRHRLTPFGRVVAGRVIYPAEARA